MSDLPKLVRNKIPGIIKMSGRSCEYRTANKSEMSQLLFEKLEEEMKEFAEDPGVEEASDIYEVFLAILNHWNIDFSSVINHSYYKRDERGGFSSGVILESVE